MAQETKFCHSSAVSAFPYQGSGVEVVDESGTLWTWGGSAYLKPLGSRKDPISGLDVLDEGSKAVLDRSGPTLRVSPTGGNHRAMVQEANDYLRNAGGGVIELYGGGVYTFDGTGLLIDSGTGVGIRGNGAFIDARATTNGTSALTLTSRTRTGGAVLPGIDTDTRNFFAKRISIEGFTMVGSKGVGVADGIDIDMSPQVGNRAPRTTIRNVTTDGFNRAIRHRNTAYLCEFEDGASCGAQFGFSYEGGADQGENTTVRGWTLGNNTQANILIDTFPERSASDNVNLRFDGCSIDYSSKRQILFSSGYGQVYFTNSYFEWNYTGAEYPFDMSADASDTMLWLFDNCTLLHTGASRAYPAPFAVGNKHDVRLRGCSPHSIKSDTGLQLTASGGVAGVPTYTSIAANVTGTGKFRFTDISEPQVTSIPNVASNSPNNNWLCDGSFSGSGILDPWHNRDGAGAVSQNTSLGHVATNCLQTTLSTGVSTAKSVRILIPRKGNCVSAQAFLRLSAGSGTASIAITPVLSYSVPTINATPVILKSGTALTGGNTTLGTDGWTVVRPTGNLPKLVLPNWCNAVVVTLDFYAINNSGGQVYIDDVHVEQW